LFDLRHAQITFGLVIRECDMKVIHKRQDG
jgi:hypothetical protein